MSEIINIGESVNKELFNHATCSANTYQLCSNYYDVERSTLNMVVRRKDSVNRDVQHSSLNM